jgi:hypothetical protein
LSFLPLTLGIALFYLSLFSFLESSLIKIHTLEVCVRLSSLSIRYSINITLVL